MRIALVAPFGLRAKGTARARALPLGRALVRLGHQVALFVPPYDSPDDSGLRWVDEGVEVVNVLLPRVPSCRPCIQAVLRADAHAAGGASAQPPRGTAPAGENLSPLPPSPARRGGASPPPSFAGKGAGGLGSIFRADRSAFHVFLAWRLFRAVRDWKPDVVHVVKPKGPSGLVGARLWFTRQKTKDNRPVAPFSALRRSSLVVDADDWEGPGGWNDDPRLGYSWAQRRFFAWQERFGLAHADAWTVASPCLRERAVALGADAGRVWVLPNGLEDRDLPRVATPDPLSAILYTRFAGVRPAAVADIWARVRAQIPGAQLIVVGRGLAGEECELAGQPGIEVLGWIEPEDLISVLANSTLAVIPWDDTPVNRARSSVKVRELMAAGLPIVAYRVGELSELLEGAAALVSPGDAEAFAGAVVTLFRDPERAARLGAAARARVRADLNWDRLAETALRAYASASNQIVSE